jgi:hypothetical protein
MASLNPLSPGGEGEGEEIFFERFWKLRPLVGEIHSNVSTSVI